MTEWNCRMFSNLTLLTLQCLVNCGIFCEQQQIVAPTLRWKWSEARKKEMEEFVLMMSCCLDGSYHMQGGGWGEGRTGKDLCQANSRHNSQPELADSCRIKLFVCRWYLKCLRLWKGVINSSITLMFCATTELVWLLILFINQTVIYTHGKYYKVIFLSLRHLLTCSDVTETVFFFYISFFCLMYYVKAVFVPLYQHMQCINYQFISHILNKNILPTNSWDSKWGGPVNVRVSDNTTGAVSFYR